MTQHLYLNLNLVQVNPQTPHLMDPHRMNSHLMDPHLCKVF